MLLGLANSYDTTVVMLQSVLQQHEEALKKNLRHLWKHQNVASNRKTKTIPRAEHQSTDGQACLMPLCRCAKQADSSVLPLHSHLLRLATLNQCTAALFRATCLPWCSVLLCKTRRQQSCASALTSIKIYLSFRCAITRHQCTATGFCGQNACLTSLCCCAKQADNSPVPLHSLLSRLAIHRGVHSPFNARQHCSGQNACLGQSCCCAKEVDSNLVPVHLHLSRFAIRTGA